MEMAGSEISGIQEEAANIDQGESQELTDIMLRRLPYFRGIALRRLRNVADAEDAVQDAFLSAYTHLEQFNGQARMSSWLTTIVINSARMKLRSRPRSVHISLDSREQQNVKRLLAETLSDLRPTPEDACRRKELKEHLTELSRRLSPSMRRTFQLYAVEGLSIRETARLLGLKDGAVKARVSRARARLRRLAIGDNTRKHTTARVTCPLDPHEVERWVLRISYQKVCGLRGRSRGTVLRSARTSRMTIPGARSLGDPILAERSNDG